MRQSGFEFPGQYRILCNKDLPNYHRSARFPEWQGYTQLLDVLPLDYWRLFLILDLLYIYTSAFWTEPCCWLHEYRFPDPSATLALIFRHNNPPLPHSQSELLCEPCKGSSLQALSTLREFHHLLYLLVILKEFPYVPLAGA